MKTAKQKYQELMAQIRLKEAVEKAAADAQRDRQAKIRATLDLNKNIRTEALKAERIVLYEDSTNP